MNSFKSNNLSEIESYQKKLLNIEKNGYDESFEDNMTIISIGDILKDKIDKLTYEDNLIDIHIKICLLELEIQSFEDKKLENLLNIASYTYILSDKDFSLNSKENNNEILEKKIYTLNHENEMIDDKQIEYKNKIEIYEKDHKCGREIYLNKYINI